MSSCYKTSNNKYFNCPPRMDDGRHFTDYRPNCHVNNLVRANNNITNSHDYRMYLTRNAEKFIDLNRVYTVQKNSCGPCTSPYHKGTMLPEKLMQSCNANSCTVTTSDKSGLGIGRKYNDRSGKCPSWPDLPVNQPYNCCADTNNLFNYYNDIDPPLQKKKVVRKSVPGGGKILSGGDAKAYNY